MTALSYLLLHVWLGARRTLFFVFPRVQRLDSPINVTENGWVLDFSELRSGRSLCSLSGLGLGLGSLWCLSGALGISSFGSTVVVSHILQLDWRKMKHSYLLLSQAPLLGPFCFPCSFWLRARIVVNKPHFHLSAGYLFKPYIQTLWQCAFVRGS